MMLMRSPSEDKERTVFNSGGICPGLTASSHGKAGPQGSDFFCFYGRKGVSSQPWRKLDGGLREESA